MPIVLEESQRRNSQLLIWNMSYASLEQTEKIKNRIGVISTPLYITKEGQSGERHVPAQWQYDHWKATDATRGVTKSGYKSIVHRRLTDPQYQESQWSHGWTLEYCKYSDYFQNRHCGVCC